MTHRLTAIILVLLIVLVACTGDSPIPGEPPTPDAPPVCDPNRPHDCLPPFSTINPFASLDGPPVTDHAYDGRNFAYPVGYFPICEPGQPDGLVTPCPYVFPTVGGYRFETHFTAGTFGFGVEGLPVYADEGYNYLLKMRVSSIISDLDVIPNYSLNVFIIDDHGTVTWLVPQPLSDEDLVWVIDTRVDTAISVWFTLNAIWALPENQFIFEHIALEIAPADFGNPCVFNGPPNDHTTGCTRPTPFDALSIEDEATIRALAEQTPDSP